MRTLMFGAVGLLAGAAFGLAVFGFLYLFVSFVEWEWVSPFWPLARLLVTVSAGTAAFVGLSLASDEA